MIKKINGENWFCCPKCGQKLHPVKPGARGVYVKCKGKINGEKCDWFGEICWPVSSSIKIKIGAGYY